MSRIGRTPISVPSGVDVKVDGSTVIVKGSRGTLTQTFNSAMGITLDSGVIKVTRPDDSKQNRSLHGLTRTLISNMVIGVSEGFKKELEINGVGYRASKQGKTLNLILGYSHPVNVEDTADVSTEVQGNNKIIVSGADRQKVGQFAAEIRGKRPPEPYKGKGIKYVDEIIIRKEGKAGKGKK